MQDHREDPLAQKIPVKREKEKQKRFRICYRSKDTELVEDSEGVF